MWGSIGSDRSGAVRWEWVRQKIEIWNNHHVPRGKRTRMRSFRQTQSSPRLNLASFRTIWQNRSPWITRYWLKERICCEKTAITKQNFFKTFYSMLYIPSYLLTRKVRLPYHNNIARREIICRNSYLFCFFEVPIIEQLLLTDGVWIRLLLTSSW